MQREIAWRAVPPVFGLVCADAADRPGDLRGAAPSVCSFRVVIIGERAMRKTAHWIMIMTTALFVAGCCDSKDSKKKELGGRDVGVSRFYTSSLSDADADRILAEANSV